ncbi:hypothetical protein TraAM80_00460 [Trypanosoma rangeli]|uniref:Uncharacterized protein n=1 Tax=Trypanosoma rangeli TaxID=5698 RepID=A0A3R7MAY4_TRYRA|nr:uncharacterized protein TraAM80_00460 [Trypanosoma rangeli]RNF12179.1 hypothetical protein TraAM80_00460 [Trypanosoma rangeli]|eukprot:RNF12179.1 hypothetical protein TraAM80_00460 [Trypanosoma rangeli]
MSALQGAANIFGRGTAAGDAIYRCYARPMKESTLDPELLARLQKMRADREAAEAAMLQPKPVPKSKAMINRPRVGLGQRMTEEEIAKRRLAALPRKKREEHIQRELRARRPPSPPAYARPPHHLGGKGASWADISVWRAAGQADGVHRSKSGTVRPDRSTLPTQGSL